LRSLARFDIEHRPVAEPDKSDDRTRLHAETTKIYDGVPEWYVSGKRAFVDDMPYPASFPIFSRILALADDGFIAEFFVRPGDRDPSLMRYALFEQGGRRMTLIRLPSNVRILDAGGGRILVTKIAADDTESIDVLRLLPA
jgi:hypothetical protein